MKNIISTHFLALNIADLIDCKEIGRLTFEQIDSFVQSSTSFWFGLELGCIMICDVTLACAQVRNVTLIKELA